MKFDNSFIYILPEALVIANPDPWLVKGTVKPEFVEWLNTHVAKYQLKPMMASILLEIEDDAATRALLKLTWNMY